MKSQSVVARQLIVGVIGLFEALHTLCQRLAFYASSAMLLGKKGVGAEPNIQDCTNP
jgi:hypothetical protein